MAYRKKCIQLKRRLAEIEQNNDSTRKRITQEKDHMQKMRLLRAILLNHLKDIMETPGKKLSPEELEKIGVMANGRALDSELIGDGPVNRPDGEALLDDTSDETDEDEPEPTERPERRRRQKNTYRETIMSTSNADGLSAPYQSSNLPSIAPAGSFSPTAPREPAMLTSSFRVSSTASTPAANTASATPAYASQSHYPPDSHYARHSSPVPNNHSISSQYRSPGSAQVRPTSGSEQMNGLRGPTVHAPPPVRPRPPFEQFTDHMRPQLEADNYPPDQIDDRISTEWSNLSGENRGLWDARYQEQMMEYTQAMDEYKKAQRRDFSSSGAGSAMR